MSTPQKANPEINPVFRRLQHEDIVKITTGWSTTKARLSALQDINPVRHLTASEREELDHLHLLAGARRELECDPAFFDSNQRLAEIEIELKRRGVWSSAIR